ncbi:MAG: pilus assembly protein [Parvularculaceae bacterium]|nr:pilus assembly protein [Parvularculaceae bacterium]
MARKRRLRGFLRSRSGATAVEFAIVAPVFLLLIFATFEVGWFYFVRSSVDSAISNSARLIRTGQAYKDGYTSQATRDTFLQNEVCRSLRYMPTGQCTNKTTVEVKTYASYAAMAADAGAITCTDSVPAAIAAVPFDTGTDRSIIRIRICHIYKTLNPFIGFSLAKNAQGERRIAASYVLRVEPDASK